MPDAHLETLAEIAPLMRCLKQSLAAEPFYEMLSGALVWTDELPQVSEAMHCAEYMRPVFSFRTSLMCGVPDKKYEDFWNEASKLFPEWPGFIPARRSTEHVVLFEKLKLQALGELDALFDD